MPNEKATFVRENKAIIAKLAGGNDVKIIKKEPEEKSAKILTKLCTVFLPMGDLVDVEQEKEKLAKNKEFLEKLLKENNL